MIKTFLRITCLLVLGTGLAVGLLVTSCDPEKAPCAWLEPGSYQVEATLTSGVEACAAVVSFASELTPTGIEEQPWYCYNAAEAQNEGTCTATSRTRCLTGEFVERQIAVAGTSATGTIWVGDDQTGAVYCTFAVTYTKLPPAPDGGAESTDAGEVSAYRARTTRGWRMRDYDLGRGPEVQGPGPLVGDDLPGLVVPTGR